MSRKKVNARTLVSVGMLSAVAIILMQFEIPLPFAPAFYQIDFSEIPVLVGSFALGPLASVAIEFIKILLNMLISGTTTAGVGDVANFLIGCSFSVPAGIIYHQIKTKKGACIGMIVGTGCMTILGSLLNAYVLLPVYAKAFELPLDSLIQMGTEVNSSITGLTSFIIFAVAPFNLLKGILVSMIVLLIYKKISSVFKNKR
ncbi:ECF transporter S component [Faecalimonas sp.]